MVKHVVLNVPLHEAPELFDALASLERLASGAVLRMAGRRCSSMAEVDAALKPRIDRPFADVRQAGRFEPVERYAADVVRVLLLGGGTDTAPVRRTQAVRPEKKVIGLIDLAALNRGCVEGTETCEIAGVGPVSVSAILALLGDAFLAVVIEDGRHLLDIDHNEGWTLTHEPTAHRHRPLGRASCNPIRSRWPADDAAGSRVGQ